MFPVKAVGSGMSVSLKGSAPVTKTWKILEGLVMVCLEINTIMVTLFKAGFVIYSQYL